MDDVKYFTKQILIEFNNAAIREKRNQALKEEFLDSLPEDIILPIIFNFYHKTDEMRVQIAFGEKRKGLLDMSMERFQMIPVAKWDKDHYVLEDEEITRKRFPYKNREWTEKVIKQPYRRQGKFRTEILMAYKNTCAVCGIQEPKILRAAHIVPVAKGGTDEVQNGICLCTNHEIAFDKGVLKIKPDGSIETETKEIGIVRNQIIYPESEENYPLPQYLEMKYNDT